MLIYKHYKGGLYLNIGYATKFTKGSNNKFIEGIGKAKFTEAKTPEQEKEISVVLVHDKNGSSYYAYNSDAIEGIYIFYKDLFGNFWLRPVDMFYGLTDKGEQRFTKLKGEELFETISRTYRKFKE